MKCVIQSKHDCCQFTVKNTIFRDSELLVGVNTKSCEQNFHWINKFTSCKSMNESRFFLFFIAIFDYRNLSTTGFLRSIAHPRSGYRLESLSDQGDVESSLPMILNAMDLTDDTNQVVSTLEENSSVVDVSEKLEEMDLAGGGEKFQCKECGNSYKKPWTLKAQ